MLEANVLFLKQAQQVSPSLEPGVSLEHHGCGQSKNKNKRREHSGRNVCLGVRERVGREDTVG